LSHFRVDIRQRAEEVLGLYPRARSAMLPLLHLAQEQDGYLSDEGIAEVAQLTGTTPADVRGTASFYDMFHLEPVGKFVVAVCTNIACLLAGVVVRT
jgi:NADH-quinone oxidoreductase subunit E